MSVKNIIIVTNYLKNVTNGIATMVRALLEPLVGAGFDISIICPAEEQVEGGIENVELVPVKKQALDMSNHRWLSFSYSACRELSSRFSAKEAIVVFSDAREAYFLKRDTSHLCFGVIHDFYASEYTKLARVGYFPDGLMRLVYFSCMKVLERSAYGKLDNLVSPCAYTRQRVKSQYAIKKPFDVVLNGVDLDLLASYKKSYETINNSMLFVGTNFYRKGLLQAAYAMKALKEQEGIDICCYVIGRDRNAETLKRKIGSLGLSGNFRFLGVQTYDRVAEYLQRCRIFCMPSLFESFANVYLEALYFGVPVIASRESGTPEIASRFADLHLVDPMNINEIRNAIRDVLEAKGETGRTKDFYPISSRRMADDYLKMFDAVRLK
jgi:glycosyltransferase involved in cell wall biosynthesis